MKTIDERELQKTIKENKQRQKGARGTEPIVKGSETYSETLSVLAVVLAILAKLVVSLKLELRSISKRITSIIFLNIYAPLQHALTQIILFVLK